MRRITPKIKRCSPEIPNIWAVYRGPYRESIGALLLVATGILYACQPVKTTPQPQEDATGQPSKLNVYQIVTGDDPEEDRSRWDALFQTPQYVYGKDPAPFLRDHVEMLPVGRALDIAMGEGRNAVFLAKKGFSVLGVDISEVAMRKAKLLARENQVTIQTINADLNQYQIAPDSYDVIVNINYLQRSLIPQIKKGLKRGGIVVYENATVDQLKNNSGKNMRRDHLLNRGELRELFRDLEILVYRETNDGENAVADLIARRIK